MKLASACSNNCLRCLLIVPSQDYAPLGVNHCQDRQFSTAEELVTIKGLGLKYTKAQYQAYTNGTFSQLLVRNLTLHIKCNRIFGLQVNADRVLSACTLVLSTCTTATGPSPNPSRLRSIP